MTAGSFNEKFFELFKEVSPDGAYIVGFDEFAGRIFIPTEANLRAARDKVRALKKEATTDLQRKSLSSLECAILLEEPQPVLDAIVLAIFSHLAKEGVREGHLLSLLKGSERALDATRKRFRNRDVPIGIKVLTLYRLSGVTTILEALKAESKSPRLRRACDELGRRAARFVEDFDVEGFGQGEFENVEKVFAREGFALGREEFYPKALKEAFDYDETPEELERMAISWIDEELPEFRRAVERLAKAYGCEPVPDAVEKRLESRQKLDPKKLVGVTLSLRKVMRPLMNGDVHRINPKYATTVVETPSYLTGTIPTGAAQFFNTFSKPFQYYFQTTDPKRDPDKSVAGLLSLLVHEEYGHCVHHSNSAVGLVGKLDPLQLLPSLPSGGPITEGLSFNRELEFLEASKRLEKKDTLTKVERDYVKALEKYGGLHLVNMEVEFWTRRYRIIRFLRAVGDVRVNTGKQDLMGFVDWASAYTGVPRPSVYFQLFPAHEGIFPGYATCYAVVGQEIRGMQRRIRGERERLKFSTYLCSIGFPPRTIYRRMLKEYAKNLK